MSWFENLFNQGLPLVVKESVEDAVKYANKCTHPFWCAGMTVDEAIQHLENEAKADVEYIELFLSVCNEYKDFFDAKSQDLLRTLLNHPDKDKIHIICDGSYYSHRIWLHPDQRGWMNLNIFINYCQDKSGKLKELSEQLACGDADFQLQLLMDNFDVVYLQIPYFRNRNAIVNYLKESCLE